MKAIAALRTAAPDSILFIDDGQPCRADEFAGRVHGRATDLRDGHGVRHGDAVAICMSRGLAAAAAIYAVLACGARYVPLDTGNSGERLAYIVGDAGCRCVLGEGPRPAWLSDPGVAWIDRSELADTPIGPALLPSPSDGDGDGEAIAAVLYTSGSTGRPKGVAVSHRAIDAFCDWMAQTFSIGQADRIASLAPFHFDLSLFDLFCAPAVGATVCFVPEALTMSPVRLGDWLQASAITTWYTVPAILGFLALKGGLEERPLPALRQILFAGEIFPTPRLARLAQVLPGVKLYNLFGPTETNVCLYWPVERAVVDAGEAIPIGVAACDAELRIDVASGELLVRGPCLMSGYWRGEALELPLDADGWYRTGDKVSCDANGVHRYHGRLDRMIKRSGYRIEPAEIERVINEVGNVEASVVVGLPDAAMGSRIVAVVAGVGVERSAVKVALDRGLPAYMRPSAVHLVDRLPKLANGKTDLVAIGHLLETPRRAG